MSTYNCHHYLFMSLKQNDFIIVCLLLETYIFPSSWFPVVPKHQLQINSFTSFHLLFQLILGKMCDFIFFKCKIVNVLPSDTKKQQATSEYIEEPSYLQQRWEMHKSEEIVS